jgi:hypothetical protein
MTTCDDAFFNIDGDYNIPSAMGQASIWHLIFSALLPGFFWLFFTTRHYEWIRAGSKHGAEPFES